MSIDTERIVCLGCGRTAPEPQGDPTDLAPSQHCGECPPWRCESCGEMCSATDLCSCWTSLDGLPLADIKALMALGDMSVGGRHE